MDVKEILYSTYLETDTNQTIAAKNVGMSCKQLSDRLTRDTLKASTFLEILDSLGVDVEFVVRETGLPVRIKTENDGAQMVQMIHGVIYDTHKSYLIWTEKRQDGTETSLYQTKDREHFLVDKSLYGGDYITVLAPLSLNGAIDFLKEHNACQTTIDIVARSRA